MAREGFEAPALFSGSKAADFPEPTRTRKPSTAALRIPGDHVRVTRLVAEDGQSIIGREVLNVDLAAIAETFGLSGVVGPAPDQIGDLVLASGKPLGLASHDPLTVKRALVGGEQRLELTGFSPDRLDWYKNKGCFTEIIRYRTRLFVPVSGASLVLPALAA